LRGALLGAPVALGLPALEAMLDGNGQAYAADGAPLRRRLGVWFLGAGVHRGWTPASVGPLQLTEALRPLERWRHRVTLISDLYYDSFGDFATNRHFMGAASVLTGTPWKSGGPQGPSLDQVVAPHLKDARRRSLELSVTDTNPISWSGANAPNRPVNDPRRVYAALFGAPARDQQGARALYLDAVTADATALRARLGVADRARLDGYLDGLRELERELAALASAPPSSCGADADAGAAVGAVTDEVLRRRGAHLSQVNRAMSHVLAAALACGHTQVFTYAFTSPNSSWGWELKPALANNHHELGHQQHADLPRSVEFLMERLAETLDALARYQEGGRTLLDNTGILVTSEVARNHEEGNLPTLLVGGAGGGLKGGVHVKHKAPSTRAGLTLARALGVNLPSYGVSGARSTEVIDGVLA
jgi:hypothetical protein